MGEIGVGEFFSGPLGRGPRLARRPRQGGGAGESRGPLPKMRVVLRGRLCFAAGLRRLRLSWVLAFRVVFFRWGRGGLFARASRDFGGGGKRAGAKVLGGGSRDAKPRVPRVRWRMLFRRERLRAFVLQDRRDCLRPSQLGIRCCWGVLGGDVFLFSGKNGVADCLQNTTPRPAARAGGRGPRRRAFGKCPTGPFVERDFDWAPMMSLRPSAEGAMRS